MIKPEELRIGNLVTLSEKGCNDIIIDFGSELPKSYFEDKIKYLGVRSISDEVELCGYGFDLDCYNYSDLVPIPLTEEILLKCGFEKYNKLSGHDGYLFNGYFIHKDGSFTVLGSSLVLCKIKHLHHLQNLYFALTGQEITIKL